MHLFCGNCWHASHQTMFNKDRKREKEFIWTSSCQCTLWTIDVDSSCVISYTANVYRELWGVYGEIRVQGFQIYKDCMLTAIPVIFEVNTLCGLLISTLNYDFFFKFPYNFCGDFRLPVIPVKFICILRGTPCNTGIPYTFYRGKICSVVVTH